MTQIGKEIKKIDIKIMTHKSNKCVHFDYPSISSVKRLFIVSKPSPIDDNNDNNN